MTNGRRKAGRQGMDGKSLMASASSCPRSSRASTSFFSVAGQSKAWMAGTKPGHDERTGLIKRRDQTEAVIHCSSFCFGWAPT